MNHQDDHAQKQAALLQHQESINAATSKLEALCNTVSQQENTLATLIAEKPDLEQLNRKYEDALAEAAAGDVDEAKHANIAIEIDAAKTKLLALEPEIEHCRKTIAGLQRKISEQEQALGDLRKDTPVFLRAFLLAESNAVGKRYLESASALLEEWRHLEGLSLLLRDLGNHPHISPAGDLLALPAYCLASFDGNVDKFRPKYHFEANSPMVPRNARVAWATQVANLIRSMGVDFDGYREQAK